MAHTKKHLKTYINVNFIKSLLVSNIDLKYRWLLAKGHIYNLEKQTKGLLFVFLRLNLFNLIFDDFFVLLPLVMQLILLIRKIFY
jgi:hypothetical protein